MSKQDLDDSDVGIIAQDIGTLDLGYGAVPPNYGNISYSGYGTDTITIDTDASTMYSSNTITLPSTTISNGGYTIGAAGSSGQFYTTGINSNNWNTITTTSPCVNITSNGIDMAAGTDITVGGKSLKEFMNKLEERLAILVPDPAKLEKFAALKKAYEHYKLMEQLCQEQPKEEE
jgi:hypothetical protein